jgi:elongation factor Ts
MGVLVALTSANAELGKDLAMQIAAMNPVAVDPESVPAETVERERAIIIDTMKADPKMAGKPEDMIAKIAEGKIGAFFKEQTLLAQAFVKDGSKSVGEYIKSVDGAIKVTEFKRVALG